MKFFARGIFTFICFVLNWISDLVVAAFKLVAELAKLSLWIVVIPPAVVLLLSLLVPATFALLFMPQGRMEFLKRFFFPPKKKKVRKIHPSFQ